MKMGRRLDFLRYCYHTEMYRSEEKLKETCGKLFVLSLIFVFVIAWYAFLAFAGYLILSKILNIVISNNPTLFQEWIWVVYGLILGLVVSVIFQAIPNEGKSPSDTLFSFVHYAIFIAIFIAAIFVWYLIIILVHVAGLL
jgi:uncharacterized BrkB/YihY/UPF0761 family membrane protein